MNNRLFVHNVSYNIHEQELEDEFMKFGKVLSCKIPKDGKNKSRGYGTIIIIIIITIKT